MDMDAESAQRAVRYDVFIGGAENQRGSNTAIHAARAPHHDEDDFSDRARA
jgi:hypothetical protein